MKKTKFSAIVLAVLYFSVSAPGQYAGWEHSGSFYIITTPEGANLPASAFVKDFPLLVRLYGDYFSFSEAEKGGSDIRFSAGGKPLSYEIEGWDEKAGTASIWVRIPSIRGNNRQEIHIHWGKADSPSASDGNAVFNASNGYIGVWHLGSEVRDVVGRLESEDKGTTKAAGVIGGARHFPGKMGVFCGKDIQTLPSGGAGHSTQAWFRPETSNGRIVSWGNEKAQGKVEMKYGSPSQIRMDCYFSNGNVIAEIPNRSKSWTHAVHTFEGGQATLYINGEKRGEGNPRHTQLAIERPARLWIGGWYNNYDFVGDIDEVRISGVARSADWVRLEYENQKPLQTLVGPLVQPGNAFSVSHTKLALQEGKNATITAMAGGAQKVYWILKRDGREMLAAVDRLTFTFEAGRVTGDKSLSLQLKAIYPDEIKTKDIAITIKEDIPEPVFTLTSPKNWDGRETVEVAAGIANLGEMQDKNSGELTYNWNVSGMAVIKEIVPGKLILKRAQNSGKMTVRLALGNGGEEAIQTATIMVAEPAEDAWVHRTSQANEKPVDNQFYARDDDNGGTIYYNGVLDEDAESVFLKIYADNKLYKKEYRKLSTGNRYAFSARLEPGLIKYKIEFGSKDGGRETVRYTASNIVCGDAFIIQGQSNAEATDVGPEDPSYSSDWIRSYGSMASHPEGARLKLWGNAVCRDRQGEKLQIGYWGLELAKQLMETYEVPIFIINGARGGTRIDQHQRNPRDTEDVATIYGRLLWRVKQAGLTHGIRGVIWHQGENDQGAAGPSGGYGWETYRQYFIDMSAAWKQDYPNIRNYYIFQIWPKACSMGVNGSDNMLREVQRALPSCFSNMGIMSTLGIEPPGGCHYPVAGYAEFARLICPLIERDNYGMLWGRSVSAANLKKAYYTSGRQDEIALEFDQPMRWTNSLTSEFYLDGEAKKIASGSVTGKVITLKLKEASSAQKIAYLDSKSWSQERLVYGENGIAALTFCNVSISGNKPAP